MQLEVVLLLEGLLADLTLEAAADAVRGEVAPEVSLALENLADGGREGWKDGARSPQKQSGWSVFQRLPLLLTDVPSGSVGRGSSGRR